MNFVLVPDSFKGTMSSLEICAAMEQSLMKWFPGCGVKKIPVADGGEGTVESFLQILPGRMVEVETVDPLNDGVVSARYGILSDGTTAIMEMAACVGLPMVEGRRNPLLATTYGVGQMIGDAVARGCRKIILGLGGSCTNDGGAGAAAALGIRFLDREGHSFIPTGGTLEQIEQIDGSGLLPEMREVELIAMCDVDNPLCGPNGASAVFGPQKGATPEQVALLDRGLAHLAHVVDRDLHRQVLTALGTGAAGGFGAGVLAFLGGSLQRGIDTVLDTVDFDRQIEGATAIFTGEGKLDTQSLRGKVVLGVAQRARRHGIPVIAVVGDVGDGIETVYTQGVTAVFSTNTQAIPFSEARKRSRQDLEFTMDNILRLLRVLGSAIR